MKIKTQLSNKGEKMKKKKIDTDRCILVADNDGFCKNCGSRLIRLSDANLYTCPVTIAQWRTQSSAENCNCHCHIDGLVQGWTHCRHCGGVKPSAVKAEWEERFENEFCEVDWYKPDSTALNSGMKLLIWKGDIGKGTQTNPFDIKDFIASELARAKEKLAKEIEGMKLKDRKFDPYILEERKDLNHTYSNGLGQNWGFNEALAQAAKKVRGR